MYNKKENIYIENSECRERIKSDKKHIHILDSSNLIFNNITYLKFLDNLIKNGSTKEYQIHFILIPINKKNYLNLFNFEKLFNNDLLNINIDTKKITEFLNKSFLNLTKLTILMITLLSIFTYIYLIKSAGFVDSIIDLSIISTTITYIFVNLFDNFKENIFIALISFLLFTAILIITAPKEIQIFISIYIKKILGFILYNCYETIKFILCCHSKKCNKLDKFFYVFKETKEKKLLDSIAYNISKKNIKSFKISSFFNFIYIALVLFILYIFVFFSYFVFNQISESVNKSYKYYSYVPLISQEYISYSAFPTIKLLNNNHVIIMGYDNINMYYYNEKKISDIFKTMKNENENEKISKDKKEENARRLRKYKYCILKKNNTFQTFYTTILLGNIDNSNIKFINHLNSDFKDISEDEEAEYIQKLRNTITIKQNDFKCSD